MSETIPCKHMFSNGTEFEWFIETHCEKCKRFRKGLCRVFIACCDARYDSNRFPYDDLLDYASGLGGKACKHFTDKPIERKRNKLPIDGQYSFIETDGRS